MTPTRPRSPLPAIVRSARPRQWVKNTLVLAAPVLSGRLLERQVAVDTLIAFVAFSLCASGIYFLNDVRDLDEDGAHPVKRHRPVASGLLSSRTAIVAGWSCLALGLALTLLSARALTATVLVYVVLSLAYCYWLKDEPLIDITLIAGGFLLRTVAGGTASGIDLSEWFLLAASFGSLFMAAGKRYAEIRDPQITAGLTRRSLGRYTESYLRFVWTLAAGILIMTYGLWSFEERVILDSPLPVLSMAPFVLAVLRYAMHVDAGEAAEPEDIALHDRGLQVLALCWAVLVAWPLFAT